MYYGKSGVALEHSSAVKIKANMTKIAEFSHVTPKKGKELKI